MIDRFCAFNSSIQRKHMKSAQLAVAWNSDGWTFEALQAHYKTLVRYLNLTDMGMVLGSGCGTLPDDAAFPVSPTGVQPWQSVEITAKRAGRRAARPFFIA